MNWFASRRWFRGFRTDHERGASLIEYVLLVALIAVVVLGAVAFFGTSVTTMFSSSGSKLSAGM